MDPRPIGMFDSGVGGLTVLHECLVSLPNEDFVYFGDPSPARFPYGPKPAATIRRFAHEIATHLAAMDTKLVVVACNAATSAALPDLQREFAVPLIGVITPEARAAVQVTRNRRVGVMATQATVASGRYPAAVNALDAGIEVTQVACPDLVPLILLGIRTSAIQVVATATIAAYIGLEIGSSTIPPVYFVAQVSPRPTPAIAQSFIRPALAIPAAAHSARHSGASVGVSLSAWWA